MSREKEFSVAQFFRNDTYEYVCRFVSAEQAVKTFARMTATLGARAGTTVRVIVTDGSDFTNMEWKFGEGVTYPPELAAQLKEAREERRKQQNNG